MVIWVGLDDTDSLKGQCTTYLASEIVARVNGVDLIGFPRLVRLNPNIPWKTRGNGALCLRFGTGLGDPSTVGQFQGREILSYPRSAPAPPVDELIQVCSEVLMELAELGDEGSQPGLVVTRNRSRAALYWRCVREVVEWEEVKPSLGETDYHLAPKGNRGLIGALAAISWRPRDRTYEVLAYREKSRWGTHRLIDEEDVMELDEKFPTTFNNYDLQEGHVALAPSSPCPVLLGIRGDQPGDLPPALSSLRTEPVDRWLVFETNQGTDDHLVRRRVSRLHPGTSAIVEGRVTTAPTHLRGGHVVFPLEDGDVVDCVAYEPSKSFRRAVGALAPGDRVRAFGSVRESPRSLNLEKLQVLQLSSQMRKVANPRCPDCGKAMKSMGRDAGYRCRRCGTRAPVEGAVYRRLERSLRVGYYEPPVPARRHISKPLKRMGVSPAHVDSQPAFATTLIAASRISSPSARTSSSIVRAGR